VIGISRAATASFIWGPSPLSYLGGWEPGVLTTSYVSLDPAVVSYNPNQQSIYPGAVGCMYETWGDQVVADFYLKFARGTFTSAPTCSVTLGGIYLYSAPKTFAPIVTNGAAATCATIPGPSYWDDGINGLTISVVSDKSCGPSQFGGNNACLMSGQVQIICAQ
jgi:hypothetical protein